VTHPTKESPAVFSVYELAEAGMHARYWLCLGMLNTIGYSGQIGRVYQDDRGRSVRFTTRSVSPDRAVQTLLGAVWTATPDASTSELSEDPPQRAQRARIRTGARREAPP
jgi:hypothetical protein